MLGVYCSIFFSYILVYTHICRFEMICVKQKKNDPKILQDFRKFSTLREKHYYGPTNV